MLLSGKTLGPVPSTTKQTNKTPTSLDVTGFVWFFETGSHAVARLSSNSLCSLSWPQTQGDLPAFTTLSFGKIIFTHYLFVVLGWILGHMGTKQALYYRAMSPGPNVVFG